MSKALLLDTSSARPRSLRQVKCALIISFRCVRLRCDAGQMEFLTAGGSASCSFTSSLCALDAHLRVSKFALIYDLHGEGEFCVIGTFGWLFFALLIVNKYFLTNS